MTAEQLLTVYKLIAASHTGSMTFPQIVAALGSVGVERYHTDYSRRENTFYFTNGDSVVAPVPLADNPMATEFSASAIEAAVRQSQRNEHTYVDFVRKTMAGGCVGYFVQITGRRAIYFGRNGETHLEPFPPAPAQ